jgi:hypothetical protein
MPIGISSYPESLGPGDVSFSPGMRRLVKELFRGTPQLEGKNSQTIMGRLEEPVPVKEIRVVHLPEELAEDSKILLGRAIGAIAEKTRKTMESTIPKE